MPSVGAYLRGLPRGLDSHPECTMRSTVLRLALGHVPLEPGRLPAPVARAMQELDATEWLPEVHGRTILAAIRDHAFDGGADGELAWSAMMGRVRRATLSAGFFGFGMPPAGSSRLFAAALRAFTDAHRGSALELEHAEVGRAVLYMEHPPGLLGPLGRADVVATLQAALGFAGIRYTDAKILAAEPTVLRAELRWA